MTLLLPPNGATNARDVATAVNQALKGKLNSVTTVTLTAGATSTTVANAFVSKSSAIFFTPQTANAAAIALPYVLPANITDKVGFVITHANDANVDKQFGVFIVGN